MNARPFLVLIAEVQGGAVGQGIAFGGGAAPVPAQDFRPLDPDFRIVPGQKTEDEFAALVETYSGDGGSKYSGGLYSHVMEGQMVDGFNEWIFDANRKSGDCEIVKTEFGYHLIYFVEKDELNYRDYMIDVNMRSEAAAEWLDEMVEKAKVGEKDISKLDLDFVISPSTYY